MASINLTAFPTLRPMFQQRERQINLIRLRQAMGPVEADVILQFWTELSQQIQMEDESHHVKGLLDEIGADINLLKAIRQSLENHKGDPTVDEKLTQIMRVIVMLLEAEEQLRRWYNHLRDKELAYVMSINIAVPSKAREKKKMDDDKKLEGQKKAKKAIEQTQKKKEEPTKKMDA